MYHEECKIRVVHGERQVGVTNDQGIFTPVDFQTAFDVLKELNLDRHVSQEDKEFLGVQ